MNLLKADRLDFDPRPQMGRMFAEGFYQWLKYFSKDMDKLGRAFAHIFELSLFYVAVVDGEVAAFAACSDKKMPVIQLDKKALRKHLGFFKGSFAYLMLDKSFNKPYPFPMEPRMGSIDFVVTALKFRGRGINFQLLEFAMAVEGFHSYVLEVASNNSSALRLYGKLGFKEFMRLPEKHPKQAGFEHYLYLKRES